MIKLLFWKLYFLLSCAFVLLVLAEFTQDGFSHPIAYTLDILQGILTATGVFVFINKNYIFSQTFWKTFFWLNLLYFFLGLLYELFPHTLGIAYLSILSESGKPVDIATVVLSIVLTIPAFYALFGIAHGSFLRPPKKIPQPPIRETPKWSLLQIAFWGYSIVFIAINFLLSLLPLETTPTTINASDIWIGGITFAPLILFWLMVLVRYKRYQWNWWKMTFVLNSLIYMAVYLGGLLFITQRTPEASGFDLIGSIELVVIWVSLLIFGYEQFHPRRWQTATSS